MYAVIETGGKQYRVSEGDTIDVEKLPAEVGAEVRFEHVLLVGEPRTYELIEKMVAHWSTVFRSRRLHLGMDETYDLGRGQYLDRNGYRCGLDIYAEHLAKVCAICARHGLRPMAHPTLIPWIRSFVNCCRWPAFRR